MAECGRERWEGEVGVRRIMCYAVNVYFSKRQDFRHLNPRIIVYYVLVCVWGCYLFTEKKGQ